MKQKYLCRCGNTVDKIHSYFDKVSKLRVTVCDDCAENLGLNNKDKFTKVEYSKLSDDQKIKEKENAD